MPSARGRRSAALLVQNGLPFSATESGKDATGMATTESGFLTRMAVAIRQALDEIAPSAETLARRETLALHRAYCTLLVEVAQLDSPRADLKRAAAAQAMKDMLGLDRAAVEAMIGECAANRCTSYYEPVARIIKHCPIEQRIAFVERLWHVANADGEIDMYEDHLVRELSDLLHVAHADFILAKHRVRNPGGLGMAGQAGD